MENRTLKLNIFFSILGTWIVTKMIHGPYYTHPMSAKIRNADRGSHDSILMLRSTPGCSAAHNLKLYFRASQKSCARINTVLE